MVCDSDRLLTLEPCSLLLVLVAAPLVLCLFDQLYLLPCTAQRLGNGELKDLKGLMGAAGVNGHLDVLKVSWAARHPPNSNPSSRTRTVTAANTLA